MEAVKALSATRNIKEFDDRFLNIESKYDYMGFDLEVLVDDNPVNSAIKILDPAIEDSYVALEKIVDEYDLESLKKKSAKIIKAFKFGM